MKKILAFVASVALMLGFAAPALAWGNIVTAPYWCGSYYSSYPCSNYSYQTSPYPYPYSNTSYYYNQYQYPYNNNYNYQYGYNTNIYPYGYGYNANNYYGSYCPSGYMWMNNGCYPNTYYNANNYSNYYYNYGQQYPYSNGYVY